jgi:predicted transglutaminase-like cysteine proteinase
MTGYSNYSSFVDINDENQQVFVANLQRLPDRSRIRIVSEPAGGVLFVDGNSCGETPCTVENLEIGRHEILIKKRGYQEFREAVSVVADQTLEYTEYLVPLPGSGFLSVKSFPDGAEVLIDGIPSGKTPTNFERIGAGNHSVVMIKSGFWNFSGIVEVKGGEAMLATADLIPVPTTAILYIDSSPPGQGIYLNDTFKGFTPATLDAIPPGDYLIRVYRPQNGALVNQSFTINAGATYDLYLDLSQDGRGSVSSREWEYLNDSRLMSQPGWVSLNSSAVIERTFTWIAKGHEASITLDIPRNLYEYYRNKPHPANVTSMNFTEFAFNAQDRQFLGNLVAKLKDASNFRSYDARNDYRNVVAFVQTIQYVEDTDPVLQTFTEYPKYPVETLGDGNGDCEDTAILAAALLREMGYDVIVVLPPGHAAVALACDNCNGYYFPLNGTRYYYLETTGAGFSLGMMDKKYEGQPFTICRF